MKTRMPALCAAAASVALLVGACGGSGDSAQMAQASAVAFGVRANLVSFGAYAQTHAATSDGGANTASAPLTAADTAEVAQRSRDWASEALAKANTSFETNAITLPPLHFGLANLVESAARGETLSALHEALGPAPSAAVQAGLMQGLQRDVSAGEATTLARDFMSAIAAEGLPGTLTAFNLRARSAADADPMLRLQVDDSVAARWSWPHAAAFKGIFQSQSGAKQWVDLVRITGTMVRHSETGYEVVGLALPSGAWAVRITPDGGLKPWGAAGLNAALAAAATAIAALPTSAWSAGSLVLPVLSVASTEGLEDRRGMALAMDEVHANLQGLDDLGGTYLVSGAAHGYLNLGATDLQVSGNQSTNFKFSPLNVNGGVYGLISEQVWFGLPPFLPACPTGPPDLRPSYFVVMQPGGQIVVLARLGYIAGTACQ